MVIRLNPGVSFELFKALNAHLVDDASFPGWRKQQGKAVQRWLDASTFELWEDFLRTRAHILERGDQDWGAEKIFLQQAME